MKKIIYLTAVLMIVLWAGSAYAESEATTYQVTLVGSQYKITPPGSSAVNTYTQWLSLANGSSELIYFSNGTAARIVARNTASPSGQPLKDSVWVVSGTTPAMTFTCSADGGNGWIIQIGDGVGGNTDAVLTLNISCAVPTLSEWGMIIFSLLILTLGTVVVVRRRTVAAVAGANVSTTVHMPMMIAGVFWKVLAVTEALAVVGLGIAGAVFGSLATRDIFGTMISAAIVAYMTHLWIGPRRE